jgi:hypothetical protein
MVGGSKFLTTDSNPNDRPWPYPDHTYIPLSIEKECVKNQVVPVEERKDQALILAKLLREPPLHHAHLT